MNYEQRYKEALKAVKELQEANLSDDGIQNWVNEKFPELKESEDEKIREAILAAIRQGIDTEKVLENRSVTYEDIETWLKDKTLKCSYEDEMKGE